MGRAVDWEVEDTHYQFLSMGRLADNFQRFPHRCKIFSLTEPTGFETEKEIEALQTVVWEGRCRKESNTSIRTFKGTENVLKGDYRVQLGALVGGNLPGDKDAASDGRSGEECGAIVSGLMAGMFVEVTDLCGTFTLSLNDAYAGNLGTSLYCDEYKT